MLNRTRHGSALLLLIMLLLGCVLLPAKEANILLVLNRRRLTTSSLCSTLHVARWLQAVAAVRVATADALDGAIAERAQDRLGCALAHLLARWSLRNGHRLHTVTASLFLGVRTALLESALHGLLIAVLSRPLCTVSRNSERLLRVAVSDDHTIIIAEHVIARRLLFSRILVASERFVLRQAVVNRPNF